MGKIKTDMENLVNGIRSSASARHQGVGCVRTGARDLLGHDRRERQERAGTLRQAAKALSTRLDRQSEERLAGARGFKAGLGSTAQKRRAAIRAGRSATHSQLERAHRGRCEKAQEVKKSVQGEVGEIRRAAASLRRRVRAMLGDIAADVKAARRLWRGGPSRMPSRRT